MHSPARPIRTLAVLAGLVLATALAPSASAARVYGAVGGTSAASVSGDIDWFFQEVDKERVVTFPEADIDPDADVLLMCDATGDDYLPSSWTAGVFRIGMPETPPVTIRFGRADDFPLCGDWDGNGIDTPGVVRGNVFHLAGSRRDGGAPVTTFAFGRADDHPLVGNWDIDHAEEVALARGNTYVFASDNVAGGGRVTSYRFGRADDFPVVSSFGGTGSDTLALRRGNRFFVSFDGPGGPAPKADRVISFGRTNDFPLAGRIERSPTGSIGVARVDGRADVSGSSRRR